MDRKLGTELWDLAGKWSSGPGVPLAEGKG